MIKYNKKSVKLINYTPFYDDNKGSSIKLFS